VKEVRSSALWGIMHADVRHERPVVAARLTGESIDPAPDLLLLPQYISTWRVRLGAVRSVPLHLAGWGLAPRRPSR
jgi:hypothetical protein